MSKLYGKNIELVQSEFVAQAKREMWGQTEIDEVLGETKQVVGYDNKFDIINGKCSQPNVKQHIEW